MYGTIPTWDTTLSFVITCTKATVKERTARASAQEEPEGHDQILLKPKETSETQAETNDIRYCFQSST